MPCFKPYFKTIDVTSKYGLPTIKLPLPCGHCEFCRYRLSKIWTFRMEVEAMRWQKIGFITLTYNNENLPSDFGLNPAHLTNFIKRLRYYLGSRKIKYYACGEYGEKTHRPHYHLIVYGIDKNDEALVQKAWQKGFSMVLTARKGSFEYVAGYVTKKLGNSRSVAKKYNYRYPPFSRVSQGLGKHLIDKLPSYTPYIYYNGKIQYLGRYLTQKLAERFGVSEEVKDYGILQLHQKTYEMYEKYLDLQKEDRYFGKSREAQAYEASILQFQRDFLARLKLKKQRELNEKLVL